jgi:hypothetical protein
VGDNHLSIDLCLLLLLVLLDFLLEQLGDLSKRFFLLFLLISFLVEGWLVLCKELGFLNGRTPTVGENHIVNNDATTTSFLIGRRFRRLSLLLLLQVFGSNRGIALGFSARRSLGHGSIQSQEILHVPVHDLLLGAWLLVTTTIINVVLRFSLSLLHVSFGEGFDSSDAGSGTAVDFSGSEELSHKLGGHDPYEVVLYSGMLE